jgi:hypothetical protein
MRSLHLTPFLQPKFPCIAGVGGTLAHDFRVDSSGHKKTWDTPGLGKAEKPVTQEHPYRDQRTIAILGVCYLSA